jgi:hypothetical protein
MARFLPYRVPPMGLERILDTVRGTLAQFPRLTWYDFVIDIAGGDRGLDRNVRGGLGRLMPPSLVCVWGSSARRTPAASSIGASPESAALAIESAFLTAARREGLSASSIALRRIKRRRVRAPGAEPELTMAFALGYAIEANRPKVSASSSLAR